MLLAPSVGETMTLLRESNAIEETFIMTMLVTTETAAYVRQALRNSNN